MRAWLLLAGSDGAKPAPIFPMCGIAGIIDAGLDGETRHVRVEKMCRAMIHRGPDDSGVHSWGEATLGSRRLAIFDPRHGRQPMSSADGRHHLVFNGAIYNFRELRRELEANGATFHTDCDTEVVLAAWMRWGSSSVGRLRGMFAFALWDSHENILSLVRDPFGIKPLYLCRQGSRLIFASEISALMVALNDRPVIDPLSVSHYLGWLAVPAPRTIYRDVVMLRPGECATFTRGRLDINKLASLHSTAREIQPCKTREEFTHELRARLEDSIRAHRLADVPVGAFLSGGLDSAAIVGLMTRLNGAPLKTFSIGFHERDADESDDALSTARHFGTHHETRIVTGADAAAELPRILAAMDQPTGDGANTYFASQAARAGGVTVALSGLGADELFGGYPSFQQIPRVARWLPIWRCLPHSTREIILRRLRARSAASRKLADMLAHGKNLHELCALQRRVVSSGQLRDLLSPDALATSKPDDFHHPEFAQLSADLAGLGAFDWISRWEMQTYMADVLLRDADVMSMRHSLELRVPFVDRVLVEWLARQPAKFKADPSHPKSALVMALRDILPPDLQHRPKRGFSLPFANWMRAELRPFLEETFGEASVSRSGLFSPRAARQLWHDYITGTDTRQWSRVWSFAVLVDFVNRGSPSPAFAGPSPVTIAAQPAMAKLVGAAGRRTLLLAPELFAVDGGIARILRSYLRALCELAEPADAVRFVALNDAEVSSADLERTANERLTDWRVCGGDKTRFVAAVLQLARDCDHLICGHVAQLPVALLAKTLNPKIQYTLIAHGIEVWRPFTLAEGVAARRAERIWCVSEFTRAEMLRWNSVPRSLTAVLPNALDPGFAFSGAATVADRAAPVILTVTRLARSDAYKGVDLLIRAMPAIREKVPNATLRIIGRGDDRARLEQLRDSLSLQASVQFLGACSDAQLTNELAACTLFTLPSSREGFGLAFLEAMARGRPCVGVRDGGVPELVTAETGTLVQPNNLSQLVAACVDALDRNWNHSAIIGRAKLFSYSNFKERLAAFLCTAGGVAVTPSISHP